MLRKGENDKDSLTPNSFVSSQPTQSKEILWSKKEVGAGDNLKKEKRRCEKGGSVQKRGKGDIAKHLHICPPLACLLLKLQIGKPVKQFNHTAAPAKSRTGGKSRMCFSLWLLLSAQICIHSNNISLNYFVEINYSGSPCLPSLSFPGAASRPPAGGQDMNRCCNSPKISPAATDGSSDGMHSSSSRSSSR